MENALRPGRLLRSVGFLVSRHRETAVADGLLYSWTFQRRIWCTCVLGTVGLRSLSVVCSLRLKTAKMALKVAA